MLRYLVEETLAGRSRELKGYTIGVSVFGREEGFDPQADPVVRLEARRLRRDLDGYYVSDGRFNPLRISVPTGKYIPEFQRSGVDAYPTKDEADAADDERDDDADAGGDRVLGIPSRHLLWWVVAVLALGLAALAIVVLWPANHPAPVRSGEEQVHGPGLMVLPFEAQGNTEQGALLAYGISDQIITELSRFPDIRLYMPPAGVDRSAPADAVETGKRLGVTYVVTGSVSLDASTAMIQARLVEVETGRILWTDKYHRALASEPLLAVQGEIATAIASALGQPYGIIRNDISRRLSNDTQPSMSSYECVLRAYRYRRTFSKQLFTPALSCLEEAVKHDPDYAEAWAMLGWLYLDMTRFEWASGDDVVSARDKALRAASKAVVLDNKNALALKALSSIKHYMGNYEEAERLQREALALNPNDPDTLAQLGWRLAARGNFEEGIPFLKRAIERTLNPPGWYFHLIAIDHYRHGRYAEMLTIASRGIMEGAGIGWSLVAIAQGGLGNAEGAEEALRNMAEAAPRLNRDPGKVFRMHGTTDDIADALVEGLRKAGWTPPSD